MKTAFTQSTALQLSRGDFIQSDGATSGRAQIYGPFDATNNPREYIAGAASLTIAAIVTVPTTAQGSGVLSAQIVSYASSAPADIGYSNALHVLIITNDLYIQQTGSTTSNYRRMVFSGFRTAYSGKTILLKITFVQGVADLVIEVNGVNVSSSFSSTTSGTPPAWLDAAMAPSYRVMSSNWPSGPAPIVTPILGTTSAADDAFYMATGKWPAWVVAGGSAANKISNLSRNSTFSAGAGATDWDATALTLDTTSGSLVITSSTADARTGLLPSYWGGAINAGYRYRVTLTVSSFASTGGCRLILGVTGVVIGTITGNGTQSFDFTSDTSSGSANIQIRQQSAGTMNLTVDDISIIQLGALSLPSIQPINVVDDVSGIGGNQGRILGGTPVTEKKSWRILGRINAASATNQQILGGALFANPLNQAIEFVDVETDGSVTLSLGDGTTATRYTASTALTAGRSRIALTTPFAADSAKTGLYVNVTSTGGTYAQFSILGHLLK